MELGGHCVYCSELLLPACPSARGTYPILENINFSFGFRCAENDGKFEDTFKNCLMHHGKLSRTALCQKDELHEFSWSAHQAQILWKSQHVDYIMEPLNENSSGNEYQHINGKKWFPSVSGVVARGGIHNSRFYATRHTACFKSVKTMLLRGVVLISTRHIQMSPSMCEFLLSV